MSCNGCPTVRQVSIPREFRITEPDARLSDDFSPAKTCHREDWPPGVQPLWLSSQSQPRVTLLRLRGFHGTEAHSIVSSGRGASPRLRRISHGKILRLAAFSAASFSATAVATN